MEFNFILFLVTSYTIGSIPFGYILTLFLNKVDIRKIGSGNIGATNVLRTGNKKLAAIVLILDILKGYAPITIFFVLYENQNIYFFSLIGLVSIIGHIFPIWLNFKGGKGVATYIGFLLGFDFILFIIFIITWALVAIIKKYSSLASLSSLLLVTLMGIYLNNSFYTIFTILSISTLITAKHLSNIKRLFSGSENKIKF